MNATGECREREALGAYALGALDLDELGALEEHLADCADCRAEERSLRAVVSLLEEIPREAFLDAEPEPADDPLRQRLLRRVRAERLPLAWRLIRAAVAVLALLVIAAGIALVGRDTSAGWAPLPAGPVIGPVSDPATGARLVATVEPKVDWVTVHVRVTGVAAGERCRLVVVSRDGRREVAGSWVVSPEAALTGSTIEGATQVAPDQLASIEVDRSDGTPLVTADA